MVFSPVYYVASETEPEQISVPHVNHTFKRSNLLKADDYSPKVAIFSPDETCIISCSDKPAITIWDTQMGEVISGPLQLTPDNKAPHDIDCVALSSDGKWMCLGPRNKYVGGMGTGGDNTMRVWEVSTGREVPTPTTLEDADGRVTHAALSNDGTKLVTASFNT